MSTVGESQDPPWKDVLYTKGLSAAATILEEYGLSCESDMSLVDEDDLVVLCSKLKPFQSKLLRKWVQGLGAEQRAAAFMKDASAAKNHSTSPPLEDKGEEDEDEEENGDEDADADEDEDSDEEDKEVHGGALPEWWRCNSGNLPHFAFVLRSLLTNAPNSCPPERLFSMFNATFGEDQKSAFGDYLELAMQSQYNKRNL
jgi:ABC-type Zn2+ transport system substrate-binding protein/surface adhesin